MTQLDNKIENINAAMIENLKNLQREKRKYSRTNWSYYQIEKKVRVYSTLVDLIKAKRSNSVYMHLQHLCVPKKQCYKTSYDNLAIHRKWIGKVICFITFGFFLPYSRRLVDQAFDLYKQAAQQVGLLST